MDGFKNSSYKFARKQDFFSLFQNLAYFDLALVRIQKVEFSDFIHSVCIPRLKLQEKTKTYSRNNLAQV